jgi:hypothetical protein
MASRITRKQATRFALVAFVAADCAGVGYVQHRMNRTAEETERLAWAEPVTVPAAGPDALTFRPDSPALALGAPVAAVPAVAAAAAPAPATATATARLARAEAPAPMLDLAASPAIEAAAHPLRAPRVAPAAGLGRVQMAVTVPAEAAAPVRHRHAARPADLAATDGAFSTAFSLDGEAPDSEHRFGQGAEQSGASSLADLVAPREEPAPIFDKAGIAPVTGQAATVDAPAAADAPAAPAADELPPIKG